MPKLGSDGKIHISIVKRKRPDGSRYVQEVRSIYDPKTKNSKVISSTTKGILPPGETDLSKLIPSDGKRGPKKKAALAREIPVITDSRQGSLVQYPLDIVLLVIVLAGLGGFLSCRQIAEYWKLHRPVLTSPLPISLIRIFLTIRSAMSSESLAKVTSTSSLSSTRSLCRSSTRRGLLPWTVRPYAQHQAWSTRLTAAIC